MQENKERPKYTPTEFENKWSEKWSQDKLFQNVVNDTELTKENKKYILFAFNYPSGTGLHVGHMEPYVALDIVARYYRMTGFKSFYPVGWDAFGLPAENYAIKTGVPPAITTKEAIASYSVQLVKNGISKDWATEIATCDPDYYKWTQWIFLKMYEKGIAYKKKSPVNWCPSCQTVLANEQVVDGECERCGTEVIQKDMEQWFFKITDYQDRLLEGLNRVDWPNKTKQQQINWIGKSEGTIVRFKIKDLGFRFENIEVFTTRVDTIFSGTYLILSPEHPLVSEVLSKCHSDSKKKEIEEYIKKSKNETDLQRQTNKEKTGVDLGIKAINPATNEEIPVWISDFVLVNYGTGAVFADAHDERDFELAKKYNIPLKVSLKPVDGKDFDRISNLEICYEGEGILVNSDQFDGLHSKEAIVKIRNWLKEKGLAEAKTTYRLRDWLLSRQRYWGAPIPIVYDPQGNAVAVKEEHLPWLLPTDVEFKPTGESPLTSSKEFKERVEKLYGKGWTPEYDTMDTFVDSSWYFLRYTDPKNTKEFASSEQLKKLLPVDLYMIGPEHTVLHLLYSRFFTKFLYDEGYIDFDEPFLKMMHQGMILGSDHKKMSKSKGNGVSPDFIKDTYGSDSLRMYEMFMGPIDIDKEWNDNAIAGVYRFLNKVFDLMHAEFSTQSNPKLQSLLHKTIKKVGEDIPALKFNTAISTMMEFCNEWNSLQLKVNSEELTVVNMRSPRFARDDNTGETVIARNEETKQSILSKEDAYKFLQILAPFAPFLAEEINKNIFQNDKSIHLSKWPEFNHELLLEDFVVIPVQINGKLRGELTVDSGRLAVKEEILKQARELVQSQLEGKTIKKEVYVEGRIVNFVI